MPSDNQVSGTLTDANVTDNRTQLAAIETLLPSVISRPAGDNNVMLREKSVAFDEKCVASWRAIPS